MAKHSAGAHRAKSHKRADIEGLRAVAILAVVAYHCGLPVPGGYVGVDVFFVISGYLITSLLWKELSSEGRVSFAGFYARRARRLLPSAVLVIVVTLLVSIAVTGPLMATAVAKDAVACALYVGNYRFAFQATNYLSSQGPVSPLQNYWSLGVEEQFYVLWPALLFVAFVVGRRVLGGGRGGGRGRHRRVAPAARPGPVLFVLALVAALSFWSCVYLTHANQPWAFFSLPTRAWELALGGFLALAVREGRRLPTWAAALLGWAGLAAVGWSLFAFNAQTVFPGPAALIPVAGTGLALVAGTRATRLGPSALLGTPPMRAVGTVSYTWYLWHWPVLILAPYVVGHALDLPQKVGLGLCSLLLAVVTTVLVEQPARRSAWLSAQRTRSLLAGAGISLGAAAMAVVVVIEVPPPVGTGSAAVTHLSAAQNPRTRTATSDTVPPAVAAAAGLDAQVNQHVYQSLANPDVPANLKPSLSDAASDLPVPEDNGCLNGYTDASVHTCAYGDTGSATSIVLFGDSHALQWFPAIDTLANQQNDAVVVMTKATCPPIDISVYNPTLGRTYTECDKWKKAELARMASLQPAVVILGFSREYGIPDDHVVVDSQAWLSGLSKMITTIEGSTGARVVLMGDDPYPQQSVPQCLSVNLSNTPACSIPRHYPYYNPGGIGQEQAVASSTGAGYVDTDPWFCISTTCTVIVGNLLVYRDDNHITASYASWLAPAVGAQLEVATDGAFGAGPAGSRSPGP
ncbi:MAG TPA: acyltransferase family protein [Acidimicrobiales bacterium]|jgi:peptidoglycan/LPS O-acetylase OafA/YrhL